MTKEFCPRSDSLNHFYKNLRKDQESLETLKAALDGRDPDEVIVNLSMPRHSVMSKRQKTFSFGEDIFGGLQEIPLNEMISVNG